MGGVKEEESLALAPSCRCPAAVTAWMLEPPPELWEIRWGVWGE